VVLGMVLVVVGSVVWLLCFCVWNSWLFRRIFDQVCETSQGYAKRSQKEEEKEDYNRQRQH